MKGWGENIVPGLRGAAWKAKVESIEGISQGVQSGTVIHPGHLVTGTSWYLVHTYARGPTGR